ncbi:hypothetical protein [Floridanema evergladense]|uniref:Uncharacterized protein n=1 Tax=Floridaenema evergladense BLCC-F167 TaxID=3153639 RepID=A0ABV4WL55_9CYAN
MAQPLQVIAYSPTKIAIGGFLTVLVPNAKKTPAINPQPIAENSFNAK